MTAASSQGIVIGRWKPDDSVRKAGCSSPFTSVKAALLTFRPRSLSPLELSEKAKLESARRQATWWSDVFFEFEEPSSVGLGSDERDYEPEEEPNDLQRLKSRCPGKPNPYTDHALQAEVQNFFGHKPIQLASGAACGGMLVGLQIALMAGLGQNFPLLIGGASSMVALAGAATSVLSLQGQRDGKRVEVLPWVTIGLSGLCSFLAPLALVPLSPQAVATVAGPIRLALPGCFGAVAIFEIVHRKWAHIDAAKVAALGGSQDEADSWPGLPSAADTNNLVSRTLRLWWKHFSPRSGVGAVYMIGNLLVTYCSVHIDLSMTQWKNGFFSALQAKDAATFYSMLKDFGPIALASSMATIYSGYLSTMWDLRWREELTHGFVRQWLDSKAYYLVRFSETAAGGAVDNFDQRLVDDTSIFASTSRGLLVGFADAVLRLVVFFPALVKLSPTPTVWQFCILLSVVSSLLTHVIGKPLSGQNAQLQRTEADFRSTMMRLRLFAEDIVLQRAEGAEGAIAARCFEAIKAATWMAARSTLSLVTYTSAYGLAGGILPLLVLAPSYFSGNITLGTLFQIEGLVGGVRTSLDFFIAAYGDIATWRAAADRMFALEDVCNEWQMCPTTPASSRTGLVTTNLQAADLTLVAAGEGHVLLQQASFSWKLGEHIVLKGAPGSGKSALLRTIAGALPAPASGHLSSIGTDVSLQTMLVTSRGFFLPAQTSLRLCMAYPEPIAGFDEDLKEALALCGLQHLVPQLGDVADWSSDLSSGDRQRLAFARLVARWPSDIKWLLLDDLASELPEAVALELHKTLASRTPAYCGLVVVSRHAEVQSRFGTRHFQIDTDSRQVLEDASGGAPLFQGGSSASTD